MKKWEEWLQLLGYAWIGINIVASVPLALLVMLQMLLALLAIPFLILFLAIEVGRYGWRLLIG